MPFIPTKLKPGAEKLFQTPIDAVLSIFLMPFWEVIVTEANRYAEQKLELQKKRNGFADALLLP
jgi:hypothetical protein